MSVNAKKKSIAATCIIVQVICIIIEPTFVIRTQVYVLGDSLIRRRCRVGNRLDYDGIYTYARGVYSIIYRARTYKRFISRSLEAIEGKGA